MGAEDFKTSFRLTPAHLKMKGNQAQNVRKAAQTFSHTNAKSILHLTKNKGLYHAEQGQALHDAILIFNDWYVLFNSSALTSGLFFPSQPLIDNYFVE